MSKNLLRALFLGLLVIANTVSFGQNVNDAAVIAVTAPVNGCNLGTVSVTITVENQGNNTITGGIPVTYTLDGTAIGNGTIPGNLNSGAQKTFTFTQQAPMPGRTAPYVINACANVLADSRASNNCLSVNVNSYPLTVGGTLSSSATVCSGTNSGTLTLSGETGTILRWEYSTNGGSTWTTIGNTTNTQGYTNLTTTTLYRVVVQSGTCASAFSNTVTITVDPVSNGGSITPANSTVCSGSNSGTLTLSGHVGSITSWESSTDGGSTWSTIANTTTSQAYNNITTTTKYRAVVKSGSCAATQTATPATVTVDPVTVGGTVNSDVEICTSPNSGSLNLVGNTGSVVRWESSTDGGVSWSNITNTTTTQNYNNLTTTTKFRAVVKSGTCASANSVPATVTVDPASVGGSVSANATVCSGSNSGTLNLSGQTGSVIRWEKSTDGGVSWSTIANTTTSNTYTNITQTTAYRAIVQSGVCSATASASATITVDPVSVGGSIASSANVCNNSNSGTLTLSGHTGNILRWETSTDGGSTWSTVVNTTTSQPYNNITATTIYRAVIKSGVCSSVNSATATLTVDPASVGGTVTSSASVCSGSNSGTLTLGGYTGAIQRWESSTDGGSTWNTITNTTTTQNYTNLTSTTIYRAVVKSGVCSAANSGSATITVDPLTVGGNVTSDVTVCAGSNSGTLNLAGNTGNVLNWEYSIDGGVTWTNIANTTNSYSFSNVSTQTRYRAVVKSGTCASSSSGFATVSVDAATVGGTLASSTTVCSGSNSGTLTLSGNTGSVQRWEYSTDGGTTWTNIANLTSTLNYTNISTNTKYRVLVKNGTCSSAYSSTVTISVDPVTVGGTVSGSATVCSGSNSGSLTLTGQTGSVLNWEYSTDGGVTWTSIANTTNSQSYNNLTATTKYRAVVQSGTCSSASSSAGTITIDPVSVGGAVSSDNTVCSGTNSGTLTLTGQTGNVLKWESSIDGGSTWSAIANTTTSQNYSNITTTTRYRAVVKSGVCSSANSSPAIITVDAVSVGGTVSGTTTVCSGSNSGSLTLSGQTGSVVRWEISTDGGSSWSNIANTTNSQSYNNLTTTSIYKAFVKSGTCSGVYSTSATVTVDAASSGGTVSSSATVCSGSNSGTLTLAGNTGSVIRWELSTDGGTTWSNIANTTTSQNYNNLTVSTMYRAVVQSGGSCSSVNSSPVTISVDPVSVGGSVASGSTVCSGSNSGTLTLSGNTGAILRWESSVDGGSTWSTISNTTNSQSYTNLAQTTIYRAVVKSGVCNPANSGTATITVDPVSVGGAVNSNATVCSGSNSGTLTLSGHTGAVQKWEYSTDGGTTWTTIANTGTTQNYTNIAVNTLYRAVVKSGTCSAANSSAATITVDPVSVGGTVSSNATVCSGSNSGTLTLSGNTGSVVRWEYSTDGGTTWTNIVNTALTYNYTNVAVNTQYRAVVKSGSCSNANSAVATITVDQPSVGGTLSSNATVCSGANSGTITLSGNTGAVQYWEYSTDGGSTWTNISNTTTSQNYTNLTQNTKYRANIKNGTCSSANSSIVTISIDAPTVGGTVASNTSVCTGSNSGTLNLSGHTGIVQNWEYSTDGGSSWTSIANTTTSQNFNNLTQTTQYRARVKNGTCSVASSAAAIVTVDAASVGGSLSGTATVCSGSNSGTITLSGQTGSVIRWELSTDGGTSWSAVSNTTTSLTYNNLTVTTRYRAVVQNGTCASTNSGFVIITVDPSSSGGSLASDATVCSGANSGTITLTGNTGSVLRWESSVDGGSTWTNIANTGNSQNYLNLTQTTIYRAVVQSGGSCSSVNSSPVTITVDPVSIGGSVSSGATVCSGSNSGTLTLSGYTGAILRWESSVDGGSTWTSITNTTNTQTYNNLTTTTQFRAVVKSGVCSSANSTSVTIKVDPATVAGTLSGGGSVCASSNSGTLTLSGYTGSIQNWETSTDGGITWSSTGVTTSTYAYSNISTTTKFRVLVKSGVCSSAYSNIITISVDPATVGGSIASATTVCSGSNSGTLTLSGYTGSILRWELSTDGGVSWGNISNTTSSLNYTNLTQTTIYRAVVQSGVCSLQNSSTATITVDPISIGGSISGSTTVCGGSNSGNLTLSGYTGSIVQWESSTDGGVTWTIIANSTNTQSFLNLNNTTQYRALIKSGVCSSVYSGTATITVDPATVGGSAGPDGFVCSGTNSGTVTLTGYTGLILNWEKSTDGGSTWTSISNTTNSQNYSNLSSSTLFRAVVKSGSCLSQTSSIATINVTSSTVGGTLSSNATVCSGSNSGVLTLGGQTGNVVQWESSADGGSTWTVIPVTTTTYNYVNLTVQTQFRVLVQSCAPAYSSSVTISIDQPTVPGTISSPATVCSGSNSGTLTLAGQTGNVLRWESSTDGGVTWNLISNTTTSQNYLNLTQSTQYRVVVQNGTCSALNSAPVTITVDPVSAGGSISGSTSVCGGTNTGNLTLSGHTGVVTQWEYSTDGGTTWTSVSNNTTTYSYNNITVNTIFRALVKSGVCSGVYSGTATITVTPGSIGGTVAGSASVCASSNAGTLTLSGNTGSILAWEYSTDGGATWSNIPNTTALQNYNNLALTTIYHAIVQNGTCPSVKSSDATITVDPVSVGGTVNGSTTVCSGANSGTLNLTGNVGSVLDWEFSTDGGITWSSLGNTSNSYTYNNITVNTLFRALVKSGSCSMQYSSIGNITVNSASVGGTAGPDASVCSGSNSGNINLSGESGAVQNWEYSIDGGATWTSISNTSTIQAYTNLVQSTLYRAVVQSGVCAAVKSSYATITVDPLSDAGVINGSTTVCSGSNGGTVQITGYTGSVLRWESSIDGGLSWSFIVNTSNTQSYANLTQNTMFRAVVQSGTCSAVYSSAATINVTTTTIGGDILPVNTTVCASSNGGQLNLANYMGAIQNWESSTDGGATWTTIANTSNQLNYSNVAVTTIYRAVVKSCTPAYSNSATIKTDALTAGGTLSGASSVCAGANSGTISLSGYTGTIQEWQASTDGGVSWSMINNTTNTHTFNNLNNPTVFRVKVQSGVCPSGYSSNVLIDVKPVTNPGIIIGPAAVCSGATGVLNLNGNNGTVLTWEASTDGGSTWNDLSNPSSSWTYNAISQTTQFRAVVQSCTVQNSPVYNLTVNNPAAGGTLSGATSVCSGSNSGTLGLSGYSGTIKQWEVSTDGGASWATITNTTATHMYNNLTNTSKFRVFIDGGGCASTYSPVADITVNPVSFGGFISGNTEVCENANSGIVSIVGQTGNINYWEYSTDGFTWNPIFNTSATQTYTNLNLTTYYRAKVQNGSCPAVTSNTATILVDAAPVGGSVTGASSECSGSNSGNLTLTGYSGNIDHWEYSTDGGLNWLSINNNSSTQPYLNLTVSTLYRAIVKNGVCNAVNSSSAGITVSPATVAGELTGGGNVCQTSNSGSLNLQNYTGTIIKWQSSIDGVTWADIANTTQVWNFSGLTTTTEFRAEVKNGTCPTLYSQSTTVVVDSATVPGTLSGSKSVCFGANAGTIKLNGERGNIIQWEYSLNNGVTWQPVTNSGNTLAYSNLTDTTLYRVLVQNNSCSAAYSGVAKIDVIPQLVTGNITGSNEICESTPAQLLLTGFAGSIISWEFSGDGITWNSMNDANPQITVNNIPGVKYYRVAVRNCTTGHTPVFTLKTDPAPIGGTLSGNATVCSGTNAGVITLNGNSGQIKGWEKSEDNGLSWSSIINVSGAQGYSNLGLSTIFRVRVGSGVCPDVYSGIASVIVKPAAGIGVTTGSSQVCSGNNQGKVYVGGYSGVLDRWESSEDNGFTWITLAGENSDSITYKNLQKTTVFRPIVSNSFCAAAAGNLATVVVNEAPRADFSYKLTEGTREVTFENLSMVNGSMTGSIWSFGDTTGSTLTQLSHLYRYSGDFWVSLTVMNDKGCSDSIQKLVHVKDFLKEDILVSNVITANGNGMNDTWFVEEVERHQDSEVHIFNRYGNEIFAASPYLNNWDATYNGKPLPEGTYFYILKLDKGAKVLKGFITVIK